MRTLTREIRAEVGLFSDLPTHQQMLLQGAKEGREHAQAPYSHFHVGAAISFTDGEMSMGCNHEVASYSQTSHAEQVALVSRVARKGPGVIDAVAVVAGPVGTEINLFTAPPAFPEKPTLHDVGAPCGHCLQILWENCDGNPNVPIIGFDPYRNFVTRIRISDALTFPFGPKSLGVNVFNR